MSDQSRGPGWWLASDGKWYPPDQAPTVPPPETWAAPPPGPPPSTGMSSGAKVGLVVGAVVGLLLLIAVAALFLGSDSTSSSFEGTGTPIAPDDTTPSNDDIALPDGYTLVEGDGVSIGAPDGWEPISPEDFNMSSEEIEQAFPDAPEGFADQFSVLFEQGAVLVAFEPSTTFAANVNIIEVPGEIPLDQTNGEPEAQLETVGAEVVASGLVDLPAGEAYRVEYTLDVAGADGAVVTSAGVQYYLPSQGNTYIITISTLEDDAALADVMAETFRVA